eukprot:scaffold3890_cov33-Attheya_sp.AAC.2
MGETNQTPSASAKKSSTTTSKSKGKQNLQENFTKPLKNQCGLLKCKDDELFSSYVTEYKQRIALMSFKPLLDPKLDRFSLGNLEEEMERDDLPDSFTFFLSIILWSYLLCLCSYPTRSSNIIAVDKLLQT